MRSYTVREAAEVCGLSYEAMRTRVDRGQLQVIKRDGSRRIPQIELEKAGLLGGPADPEVAQLRSENAQLRHELQAMRTLPARVEAEREARQRMEEAFHQARAEQQAAEHVGEEARRERDELNAQLQEIASAGLIRAFKLRRRFRAEHAA